MTVFLTTEDQNLCLRDRASTEPVLDIILKALWPNFDKLPVWLLIARVCVEALNICDWGLIPAQHIDVAILDSHGCWKIPVPVKFRLLSPLIPGNTVDLTCLARIIESASNGVDEVATNRGQAVPLPRI